jgi:hypothetical protein
MKKGHQQFGKIFHYAAHGDVNQLHKHDVFKQVDISALMQQEK